VHGYAQWLRIVLRCAAALLLAALVPVFFPFAWMQAIHRAIGLGELPAQPIVEYMARSLSAFYACYGALMLYLSFDVARHLPVVRLLALLGVVFGAVMIGIDVVAGLPRSWTLAEGPFIIVLGFAILLLARKAGAAARGARA
jgi:hypothetical protein